MGLDQLFLYHLAEEPFPGLEGHLDHGIIEKVPYFLAVVELNGQDAPDLAYSRGAYVLEIRFSPRFHELLSSECLELFVDVHCRATAPGKFQDEIIDHRIEYLVLALEVVIDRAFPDAYGPGYLPDGDCIEALCRHEVDGHVQYPLPGGQLIRLVVE